MRGVTEWCSKCALGFRVCIFSTWSDVRMEPFTQALPRISRGECLSTIVHPKVRDTLEAGARYNVSMYVRFPTR